MNERVIRISLDINVLCADLLSTRAGLRTSAASFLVNAVRDGECPAGPVQLITSVPVIENWASVLQRHFAYTKEAAEETAGFLYDYATEGALGLPPNLVVGSGHVPFADEEAVRAAMAEHARPGNANRLFDEIADDRYVLLGAIAGEADLLATSDIDDFFRGPATAFEGRTDVILYPAHKAPLVVGKPAFIAHWLRRGVVPDAIFIAENAGDFVPAGPAPTHLPGFGAGRG